jgi:hypothetical protein
LVKDKGLEALKRVFLTKKVSNNFLPKLGEGALNDVAVCFLTFKKSYWRLSSSFTPVFVCKGFELLGRFVTVCLDCLGKVLTVEKETAAVEDETLAVALMGPAVFVVFFFVFNLRLAVRICMEF